MGNHAIKLLVRTHTCMQLRKNSLFCNFIKTRSVVQIKDALMYSHQENKSDSAVADD